MKEVNLALLRKKSENNRQNAFVIAFRGEDVQGNDGPFRQFFEDISNELQPTKIQAN